MTQCPWRREHPCSSCTTSRSRTTRRKRVAGFVAVAFGLYYEYSGSYARIVALSVSPDMQGQGIGNYAPTLVMLSLMGMDPRLSFPIMAAGAALTATGASMRYISIGEVDLRIASGIALGGIPAVLVAAFIVKSMSVELLRWLVVCVVMYAAIVMLKAAANGRRGMLSPEPQC